MREIQVRRERNWERGCVRETGEKIEREIGREREIER